VEALARTDARSDHAVLDFLVTFFIKKKGKNNRLLLASSLKNSYHLNSTQTSSTLLNLLS
jgi:hypothetical protein